MWFWSDNPKSCCQLVVWPLSCMPVTSNGRKPSEQRNLKLFAHHNTCDRRRHNGSIAAWSWNRAYQPECQDNWWGAQSVIGLPVLSVLVLDFLRDSFTRQGCQPRGGEEKRGSLHVWKWILHIHPTEGEEQLGFNISSLFLKDSHKQE